MKPTSPLIVGNWKQNPMTLAAATTLAKDVAKATKKSTHADVAIAPPHIYLPAASKVTSTKAAKLRLAAQTTSVHDGGAHTGEVTARQLQDLGAQYVIVGHSERRASGVTDKEVATKIQRILTARLTPIVCIGEEKRDRNGEFFNFIKLQLASLTKHLPAKDIKKLVIAYEPIWAIGTGKTATVEDVKEMQLFIKNFLTKKYDRPTAAKVRLLYGGSVKPHNAMLLHKEGDMNGFLVGGASLRAADFAAIIEATKEA